MLTLCTHIFITLRNDHNQSTYMHFLIFKSFEAKLTYSNKMCLWPSEQVPELRLLEDIVMQDPLHVIVKMTHGVAVMFPWKCDELLRKQQDGVYFCNMHGQRRLHITPQFISSIGIAHFCFCIVELRTIYINIYKLFLSTWFFSLPLCLLEPLCKYICIECHGRTNV